MECSLSEGVGDPFSGVVFDNRLLFGDGETAEKDKTGW